MTTGLIVAASSTDADLTAIIDWGWQRAMVNGKKGWKSPDGSQSATRAYQFNDLRGLPKGTPIYFTEDANRSPLYSVAQSVIASGRAIAGKPVVSE